MASAEKSHNAAAKHWPKPLELWCALEWSGVPDPCGEARPTADQQVLLPRSGQDFLLIAHRGASAYRPENTLAAFEHALFLGVDYLELDIVPTRDHQLVARHENELSRTTDVAGRNEFADRRTTRTVDRRTVSGWFSEDFSLSELKTLGTRERLRQTRPANVRFDGVHRVPTLAEILAFAESSRTASGRRVGVFVEIKHPSYFRARGLPVEEELLSVLSRSGYAERGAPIWIESSEPSTLQRLAELTEINLVQVIRCLGRPYDLRMQGDNRTYAHLTSPQGLREIEQYAVAIALCKEWAIPRNRSNRLGSPSPVIVDAHRAGLSVLGWTFRRENRFLPTQYRIGRDPFLPGDSEAEIRAFAAAGMDGFFLDQPDVSREVISNPPAARRRLRARGLWGRPRSTGSSAARPGPEPPARPPG